jgi:SAM-dependent methyltransferase
VNIDIKGEAGLRQEYLTPDILMQSLFDASSDSDSPRDSQSPIHQNSSQSEIKVKPQILRSRIVTDCTICGSSSQRKFVKEHHWIRSCKSCGHEFLEELPSPDHPDQVYGDDYFYGGAAGYPDYLAEGKLIRDHGRRYAKIVSQYMQPGKILDVGAAAGFALNGFLDYQWQGDGIEPNAGMAAFGRNQLSINVQPGSLENLTEVLPGKTYDLVSMIQVIPHFYDLHQALAAAAKVTNPGGHWLIETWNRDSRTAQIFGVHWHEYSPPSVLRWFSPADLTSIAAQYGFKPIAQGRPEKWLNGAHVKSLLSYKLKRIPGGRILAQFLKLIPDRLRIPYPAEDLFWMLFEKES